MHDQFNLVSLANLSKPELLALLANLQGQLDAAFQDDERSAIQAQIAAARLCLQLR